MVYDDDDDDDDDYDNDDNEDDYDNNDNDGEERGMIVAFTQSSINLRPSSDTGGVHLVCQCDPHQV